MSTPTISVTESMLMTALRTVLLALVPTSSIVQGYQNRVALPNGAFLELTSLLVKPLSMTDNPRSGWVPGTSNPGVEGNTRSNEWVCQVDCFGAGASEMANLVALLVRTSFACTAFGNLTPAPLAPLFTTEPRQLQFLNDSNQYEARWLFEFHAQYNPVVLTPLDFADTLEVIPVSIDARFPPES